MSKSDEAVACFKSGLNCSQAIISVFAADFGMDKELACKIACAFGAGMGRLGEICGTVTGAFMVLGLKYGNSASGNKEAREKTYALVQEFSRRFKERNNSILCRELVGANLLTGDREKTARQVKLTCPKMVKDAAEILEELLAE